MGDGVTGGFAGTHTLQRGHGLKVGPTAEDKHNTYRLALVPLACWHIKDIRFEFESSFVLPDAAEELRMLKQLRDEHPGAPLSLFGHADPVGEDKYNKELSGRRVRAVYAMLIRREAMWEELYSKPHSQGGDAWGQKSIRTMQDALGLPHSTVGSKLDRALLFRSYMDLLCGDLVLTPEEFLAQGADPDGKGDYQGCGEFNPLVVFSTAETAKLSANHKKRNEENAPNRRVLAYLFRPGSIVTPDRWPCPRSTEDKSGCEKRLWTDAKTRRSPGGSRREFDTTKDTFGCRFYHRIAVESPCERASPSVLFITNLRFEPPKAACGEKVTLLGATNLGDTKVVRFQLKALKGSTAPRTLDVTVAGGLITHEFEIKDVDFKDGTSFLADVDLECRLDPASPSKAVVDNDKAMLKVEALLDAPEVTFTKTQSWSGFTNNASFAQKLTKFRAFVEPRFKIMKMWGGYRVNLNSFSVTGVATNGPGESGWRWARATGTNPMMPNQYHDGAKWVNLPNGFSAAADADATLYSSLGFVKKGNQFFPQSGFTGGPFPSTFVDYEFDSASRKAKRDKWVKTAHDRWTGVFQLRRKKCRSANATRCCRYDVQVDVKLIPVDTDAADVIAVCPEGFRSNAGTFFMGDSRDELLAHEAGHHMDNPDEYKSGAVDTTVNGDGAVNGIDDDSIMGKQNSKVKKRHYHAFNDALKSGIKQKYGRDFEYETVDKI